MSKKTIKSTKQETVNLTLPKEDAAWIQAQIERRDRPNLFLRMGLGIKEGTFATGRFFNKGKIHLVDYFGTLQENADKALFSVKEAKTKQDMICAAEQLEVIAKSIREFAGQVELTEVKSQKAIKSTTTVPTLMG